MKHELQVTVDRLPEILEKNAPGMMRRMILAMRAAIERGAHLRAVSHGALFLKVGEADLVREFEGAMKDAMSSVRSRASHGSFEPSLSLSLDSLDDEDAPDELEGSTQVYATLCHTAQEAGVAGLARYKGTVFWSAVMDAFVRSRMDARAISELMPYARAALNVELMGLYQKLDDLGTAASPG
jgi:hypothetical protein